MSYYDLFLLLHVYFFVQKCLHVPKCCKYFILSSVILPLNVEGTTHCNMKITLRLLQYDTATVVNRFN